MGAERQLARPWQRWQLTLVPALAALPALALLALAGPGAAGRRRLQAAALEEADVHSLAGQFDIRLPSVPERLPDGMEGILKDIKKDVEEGMTVKEVLQDVKRDWKKDMPGVKGDIRDIPKAVS
ncbi:unnamed protein product [Prorocentrum cordatum]|uniref:Uncharacterized protein n=1 Tax=Prorocentrum cordatum TaxID=2364126 RepID=A0ABN9XHF6_9DINO|nr:unnamed protein product [Polarella glacialis]